MKQNFINNEFLTNNYQDFINFIKTKKNIYIVGKGYLEKNLNEFIKEKKIKNIINSAIDDVIQKKKTKYNYDSNLYIGVKNTLFLLPKKDILIINDFEGIFGNEKYLKELKYILFPINIHYKCVGSLQINFNNIIEYIYSYNFKGKLIIYKLNDPLFEYNLNQYKLKYPNINYNIFELNFIKINSISSADVLNNLLINLGINFKINIDYFGICKSNKCNPEIEKNLRNSICLVKYKQIKKEYLDRKYNKNSEKFYNKFIPKYKKGFIKNKYINSKFN